MIKKYGKLLISLGSVLVFLIFLLMAFDRSASVSVPTAVTYLEQNWTNEDRAYFYFADQGSRLIPYDYFLHLEQADDMQAFRADANMTRLGFIPTGKSANNPDGLPIGLGRHDGYLAPTCAACHTQQLRYQGETIVIDGGQGLINLNQFLHDLTASLKATLDDPEKFGRFQENVLGSKATEAQKARLKKDLQAVYEKRSAYQVQQHTDLAAGYARLDAFGAILNQALLATGVEGNRVTPNAPTSIPFIWDTPQHDYVEWNGSQTNTGVGALARNIGEVIGVFGDVDIEAKKWLGWVDGGYASSIQTRELRRLERTVSKLHSPLWPKRFPKINQILAKQGRGLYEQYCIACHQDIDRTDPKRLIQVRMSTIDAIKTDPLMAKNAIGLRGQSGRFEGRPRYYFVGDALPAEGPAIHIANHLMVGIVKNHPLQAFLAKKDARALGHPDVNRPPKFVDGVLIEEGQEVSDRALLAYKARPLNGIWTSAPFLHNGSVANLYELLLPARARRQQFRLGTRAFDPQYVGYVLDADDSDFVVDTTLAGNRHVGHEYGTGVDGKPALTEQERWALLEYLKTL